MKTQQAFPIRLHGLLPLRWWRAAVTVRACVHLQSPRPIAVISHHAIMAILTHAGNHHAKVAQGGGAYVIVIAKNHIMSLYSGVMGGACGLNAFSGMAAGVTFLTGVMFVCKQFRLTCGHGVRARGDAPHVDAQWIGYFGGHFGATSAWRLDKKDFMRRMD